MHFLSPNRDRVPLRSTYFSQMVSRQLDVSKQAAGDAPGWHKAIVGLLGACNEAALVMGEEGWKHGSSPAARAVLRIVTELRRAVLLSSPPCCSKALGI